MRTVNTDAHQPAVDPETDTVSVALIGRLHRCSQSIFPCVGKGVASGVSHNSMRASALPKTGVPTGGAIGHFANSIRIFYAELATFLLARDALVELTGSIA